ncbi:MAG: sialidase family protein [Acidobacteriota bacterium]
MHLLVAGTALLFTALAASAEPSSELVLPFEPLHNHGSSLVETPDGGLFVVWFRGSGERKADDVAIYGAVRRPRQARWSEPFLVADTPGFPDTNCTLLVDREGKLWLLYPTILANLWETALMKVKVAEEWGTGPPDWEREFVLHMKPGDDFPNAVRAKTADYLAVIGLDEQSLPDAVRDWRDRNVDLAEDKLTRRLGWFTRPHPIQLSTGRLLVGLYSDGFSFSMTTFSDDDGATWQMSEPIVGGGNIQPSLIERADGTVVAYMRDNGPPPKKVLVSESRDGGATWSTVRDHEQLVDSGAGVDALRLRDGRVLVVHNDVPDGRHRLTVSLSNDEGRTFRTALRLEDEAPKSGRFSYPSAIEGKDGTIHVTYSVHLPRTEEHPEERKSIRHAWFGAEELEP